jgi:hypothetical protein
VVQNNIMSVDLELVDEDFREIQRAAVLRSCSSTDGVQFLNNIFDFSGLTMKDVNLGLAETPNRPFIDCPLQSFENNIIYNYDETLVRSDLLPVFKNNICAGSLTDCGTDKGNVASDPKFNTDYSLQTGSPGIDAGSTALVDSDLDRSRNDIGAYGGSWSIGQFDAQRDPAATGPYLYPLIDASKSAANGAVKVKFVSYPRLK